MSFHYISPKRINLVQIKNLIDSKKKLALSEESVLLIEKCYQYLHKKIKNSDTPVYGINTGFGSLCNTKIEKENLTQLQENLVKSHACGMGEEVPNEIVQIMLLLKIQALSLGHSGVSLKTIHRLIEFYNQGVYPIIFQQGSLGASGDLAPLAHFSLPLIGEGEVYFQGQKRYSKDVLAELNLEPLKLEAKEGLALLNGTQFMSAYAVWCLLQITQLSKMSDLISGLSLDASMGRYEPFNPLLHTIRHQKGQAITAQNIRIIIEGSEIGRQDKKQVQDPYSFRCIPQVHGASKDVFAYALGIVENEINAVTDNPTLFPDEDLIISGGNFHGQPLAITLDLLAIAIAELGSISERRVYKMISSYNGLPSFLVSNPGLNSGFMIPQYVAASIVSQNKQLCTPASVDTIDSSQGQEDHVSMGANAATKLYKVITNVESVLAIELLNAAQALEFRRPLKSSPICEDLFSTVRKEIDFVKEDQFLHELMMSTRKMIGTYTVPEVIVAF